MAEHRQEFERELEAIEAKVIELFAMVAEDLPEATKALLSGNNEIMQQLLERDQVIDALYPEIEELANREILLQAPVAPTCASCCRCCASCPSSSAPTTWWSRSPPGPTTSSATTSRRAPGGSSSGWASVASDMWRQAADCWYQRDRSAALALAERDDEMDELLLQPDRRARLGQMALPVTMEMTLVARFYERLGDHAVNIARRVVYLAGSAPTGLRPTGLSRRAVAARPSLPAPAQPTRPVT